MEGNIHKAVVHYQGQRIAKMKRAWNTVRTAAGLGPDVTPHTLRHTCCSWLLWGREAKGARPATKPMTIWEVAGVIGADATTVQKVYGHHRRPE
jgi:integrase